MERLRVYRRSASRGRAPSLTRRFALYAALALLAAGGGLFCFVRSDAISRAEGQALVHTGFIADSILRFSLRAPDFRGPVSAVRRRQLDALFAREVLLAGALRVKLYTPAGLVVYSNDPTLIGKTPPDPSDIRGVAKFGRSISDVSTLNGEGGSGPDRKVLETYVPARAGGTRIAGVFELYQDYAPISAAARRSFMPLAALFAVVMLGLYLSFFPILRSASSRLRRQLRAIEYQSLHDPLTGLPNRTLFRDRVEQALKSAQRRGERAAVMLLDLDRFKEVNDTLGHQTGDLLLRRVAETMCGVLRESDTVARLGGDEFAVLTPSVSGAEGTLTIAAKLRNALLDRHDVAGLELEVDASIGIAIFPDDGTDVDTLLQRADIAMYISKDKHEPTHYACEHDHYSPARLALMSQLRRAISDGELIVYYQPQADARSGAIQSVEALVRWQHPEHGLLPPDAFIPLAEQTGLIRALTLFVLDTALRQCRAWRDDGLELGVAVNIASRDLLDVRLPEEVHQLLGRWEIPPESLELEITENTVLSDPVRSRKILQQLDALGVRLAIDDFGSGNSSLAYLKRLPVGVLKIDKSFVLNMQADPDDAVIVRSTIDLGHNLGLTVVAEGVEDLSAWQELDILGCDTIQGYYLARPSPPDVIAHLVNARRFPDRAAPAQAT
jgi:diguanylate cyclase (GGDEF)-like protein